MTNEKDEADANFMERRPITSSGMIAAVVVLIGLLGRLWHSTIQSEVYRRQGVEMTVFEVFMGAKPVERYVKEWGE